MSSKKYTNGSIVPGCICSVLNQDDSIEDTTEVEVISRFPYPDYSEWYLCKFVNKPDFPSEACIIFNADNLHCPYIWC